jgi:nucleotide-binding universal stress UspA family protein
VKRHVPRGDPRNEVARLARKIDAGLVVMGNPCRVGLFGLVMGSAAGTVLSDVPCGVLAVKSNHLRTADTILRVETEARLISGAEG